MKIACMILVIFFVSICINLFVNKVLIQKVGLDNSLVKIITSQKKEKKYKKQNINWQKLYPFKDREEKQESSIALLQKKINDAQSKIMDYSSKNLFFYQEMIEVSKSYKQIIGKIHNFRDAKEPFEIDDNYFVEFTPKASVKDKIEATVELANFCKENTIDFLFVQPPVRYDAEIGARYLHLDYSDENVEEYLSGLKEKNINQLDLRENVIKEGVNVHDIYFGTDHHWKPEAGLWATKIISAKLNSDYGFNIDTSMYDFSKYEAKIYENLFLGSYGRKATLIEADMEDFTMFYPKFKTKLNIKIPDIALDKSGDFSITYDMSAINTSDVYNTSIYATYNYSQKALIRIHNSLAKDKKKVLIVKDSFANVVSPFLALGIKDTCIIDLRSFNGSLQTFIKDEQPDLVVLLYSDLELVNGGVLFDFR